MSSNSWTKLKECPIKLFNGSIRTGTNTFLLLSYDNGIWQYKVNENEWTQIMKYVSQFKSLKTISYNTNKNIIHLLDSNSNLFQICLQTKEMKKITNISIHYVTWSRNLFCINNKLHIFEHTPQMSMHHRALDLNKNGLDFKTIRTFQHKTLNHAAIYLPTRQRIVLFTYARIMEYCVLTNEWTIYISSVKFPQITSLVTDKYEQFVIMSVEWYDTHRIIMYHIETRKIYLASYKLPTKEICHIIMMDNPERDNLIVFGYVHDCFKRKEFDQIPELPFYLIRLIGKWICNEQLHLFSETRWWKTDIMSRQDDRKHWKINLDNLFKDTHSLV